MVKLVQSFNRDNPNWANGAGYNRMFLQAQFAFINDLLQARDFVTVNDAYQAFGFEPNKAALTFGWERGERPEISWLEEDDGSFTVTFDVKNLV